MVRNNPNTKPPKNYNNIQIHIYGQHLNVKKKLLSLASFDGLGVEFAKD